MGKIEAFPSTPPMPAVARILSRYDRAKLEAFLAIAIDLIDTMDGDTDVEPNGDEQDGDFAEDEETALFETLGSDPGCKISDPDLEHDDREPEDHLFPSYGIDQTHPLPEHLSEDRELLAKHIERIRRTRCDTISYGGTNGGTVFTEHRLRGHPPLMPGAPPLPR